MRTGIIDPPDYLALLPLDEVKAWLVVDTDDEDSLIESLINSAFSTAEKTARMSIAESKRYAEYRKGKTSHFVPYGPVITVDDSSVDDGDLVDGVLYTFEEATETALRLEYTAGVTLDEFEHNYAELKAAILRLISYWYDDRDAGMVGKRYLPADVKTTFRSYWTSPTFYRR